MSFILFLSDAQRNAYRGFASSVPMRTSGERSARGLPGGQNDLTRHLPLLASPSNVGAFDLQLPHRKSIIVTRPTLRMWIATRPAYEAAAASFFEALTSGKVRSELNRRYALSDIRRAHEELQGRGTIGPAIIVP